MVTSEVQDVISYLNQLKEDPDISKRFKEKTAQIILLLTQDSDIAVDKALFALEELNATDLSSYHRTKVWDVISMLESSKTRV